MSAAPRAMTPPQEIGSWPRPALSQWMRRQAPRALLTGSVDDPANPDILAYRDPYRSLQPTRQETVTLRNDLIAGDQVLRVQAWPSPLPRPGGLLVPSGSNSPARGARSTAGSAHARLPVTDSAPEVCAHSNGMASDPTRPPAPRTATVLQPGTGCSSYRPVARSPSTKTPTGANRCSGRPAPVRPSPPASEPPCAAASARNPRPQRNRDVHRDTERVTSWRTGS